MLKKIIEFIKGLFSSKPKKPTIYGDDPPPPDNPPHKPKT